VQADDYTFLTTDIEASMFPALELQNKKYCWSASVAEAEAIEKRKIPARKHDAHTDHPDSFLSRASWSGASGNPYSQCCRWCRLLFNFHTSLDMDG